MQYEMQYEIVFSKRKTLAITVTKDCKIVVRAPFRYSKTKIDELVKKHQAWIEKKLAQRKVDKSKEIKKLDSEEIQILFEKAQKIIPERLDFYAKKANLTYNKLSFKLLKSRWGSCSSKGNLCFNVLLMLTPLEVLDSVIVHELCHLKQMNHQKAFYDEVLSLMPDYHKHNAYLKEHGTEIMNSAF